MRRRFGPKSTRTYRFEKWLGREHPALLREWEYEVCPYLELDEWLERDHWRVLEEWAALPEPKEEGH